MWRVLSDVMSWSWWLPTVNRIQAIDGDQLKVGARFRIWQPRLLPVVWTVTEVANDRFSWQSRFPGLLVCADHVILALSERECHLELRLSYTGALGRLARYLYGPLVKKYLMCEARMLAELAELSSQGDRGEQIIRPLI